MFGRAPMRLGLFRVAGHAAASSVVAAVGLVFFVLLYLGIFTGSNVLLSFGPANDVCVLAQYALALPAAVALHRILGHHAPRASLVALCLAVVGGFGVVVFQTLLLTSALSFEQQVLPASLSVLLMGVWILLTSRIGHRSGEMGGNTASGISAALYFGFPLWIWRVGRQLLRRAESADA